MTKKPKYAHAGQPTKYKPEYCERVMELGKEGMSPVQIACELDVARTTLLAWSDKHPEFLTAITRAKELEQAHWEALGYRALFADKFQAQVWKKSMEARFRNDYTERKQIGGDPDMSPIKLEQVERVIVDASDTDS